MPSTVARPDYEAHTKAVRLPIAAVAADLARILGLRLTAYLGSVKETRAVREWADGAREPSALVQRRLRLALQVADAISRVEGPEVTRAWFQGLNPQLADRSPARLVREGDVDEVGPEVIGAARAFLAGG